MTAEKVEMLHDFKFKSVHVVKSYRIKQELIEFMKKFKLFENESLIFASNFPMFHLCK